MMYTRLSYQQPTIGRNHSKHCPVCANSRYSYFNIGDGPTIEGTKAILYTNVYQAKDDENIPTGGLENYPGITAGEEFTLGAVDPAVDHCFVIDTDPSKIPLDTRQEPMKKLCQFQHPSTKLHLEVLSTEPAFQFYTGEYVDAPAMDGMPARGSRCGMCIEASRYINAINHEDWRQMVLLKRGTIWVSTPTYYSTVLALQTWLNICLCREVGQNTELGWNSTTCNSNRDVCERVP